MRKNKQAMPCPAGRDGCILNGPLQDKQEVRSLIGGLSGDRGHLTAFESYRYGSMRLSGEPSLFQSAGLFQYLFENTGSIPASSNGVLFQFST